VASGWKAIGRQHYRDKDKQTVKYKAAKFGERNKVIANVYAPNGTLWLKEKTDAEGAFIAKWVVIGEEVELTLVSGW